MLTANVKKICIFHVFLAASTSLSAVIFSPYLKSLGLGLDDMGLLISMFALSSLASRVPFGLVYNSRRAKRLAYLSLGLLGGASLAYTFVGSSYPLLMVLRVLQGLGFGGASTMGMALLMDNLPSASTTTRVMGWYMGSLSVGHAAANALGGFVAEHLGYTGNFMVAAVMSLVAATCIGLISIRGDQVAQHAHADAPRQKSAKRSLVSTLAYLRQVDVLAAAILAFSQNFLSTVVFAYFPLYALGVGLSLTSVGFLSATHSLASAISRPAAGEIIRLVNYHVASDLGVLVNGVFLFVLPSFTGMAALLLFQVVLGSSRGLVMVTNAVGINDTTRGDPTKRGAASSVYNGAGDLGGIIGPFAGGLLATQVGLGNMMRITSLALLVFYFAFVAYARLGRVRREVPT